MNVHPPEWAWSQSHLFCFCEQMMIKTRSAALSVPKMQPAGPISTTTGHLQVKSKKVLHLDHFKQTTCVDIIKYSPKSRLASGKCRLWAASLTHSLTSSQGGGWRVWELDPALSPNVWSRNSGGWQRSRLSWESVVCASPAASRALKRASLLEFVDVHLGQDREAHFLNPHATFG